MREVLASDITQLVAELCVEANTYLPEGLKDCIYAAREREENPLAQAILGDVVENFTVADQRGLPICQDTGMAVVFLTLGQEVHVVGGGIEEAVNAGVAKGYVEGKLRCSVVGDPLRRVNTGDNTPAVLHVKLAPGDEVSVTVAPKGFGSENMSKMKMFTPAATKDDIVDFVAQCVKTAGSNPCPPVVVGVGLGGDFESCALAAKEALCRPVGLHNPDEFYAALERETLERLNTLDVGPQGFGGDTTALWVSFEPRPTHIAGLPCAVNMGCHVTRHASGTL